MFSILFMLILGSDQIWSQEVIIDEKIIVTNEFYHAFLINSGSGSGMDLHNEYHQNRTDILEQVRRIEEDIPIENKGIQLVFHVLHTDDVDLAQKEVQSQVEALNRDFSGKSHIIRHANDPKGEFERLAIPASLTFSLASTTNDAKFGKGIFVVKNGRSDWDLWEDMKSASSGGSKARNPSSAINVWVVKLPSHLGSFATRPYWSDHDDGIVIDYRLFGDDPEAGHPFNQGKTLTHLIGNYLGLDALWGPGDYCMDDDLDDTPIHNAPNHGIPPHEHISTCEQNLGAPEMVMNFMDSCEDSILTMFTEDQVRRMHAILQIARPGLLATSTNGIE